MQNISRSGQGHEPPIKNVHAPSIADAIPLYRNSKSSEKLVDIGKIAPANSKAKNNERLKYMVLLISYS
jgi:hypothetical protein